MFVSARIECTRKPSAEEFPRNFALIRLAERTLKSQKEAAEAAEAAKYERVSVDWQSPVRLPRSDAGPHQLKIKMEEQKRVPEPQNEVTPRGTWVEEDCVEHKRKLEIICITDRMRICSTCALFG